MNAISQQSDIMRKMLEPLTESCSPETAQLFANLQATPEMAARLEVLGDKCNEGQLTAEERTEYETYVRVGNLFGILKAEGRKALAQNS